MNRRQKLWLAGGAVVGALVAWTASELCIRAWLLDGIVVPTCPSGEVRPTFHLDVTSARRGRPAQIVVRGDAHYTTGPSDEALVAGIRRLSARLEIVDPAGKVTPLEKDKKSHSDGPGYTSGSYALPDGPDGDWTLRATIDSSSGPGAATLKVPLYAPARVHVMTDRPLYQAGQVVLARALALRASDLAPLDGRPGTWMLESPAGEVVLEEKAPLGEWGVVGGSFPLDPEAETGDWSIRWVSGGAEHRATFRVEPFVLPRFRIEAEASRAYYRPGDVPRARGAVRYASGAPVARASITIVWSVSGDWPPPTDWTTQALPQRATTDAAGRFELELPMIPRDLQGRVTLAAALAATDDTGDRVDGALSFLLSEDGIAVDAVTELQGGLVEGFNNRVFIRATSPEGTPLTKTKLLVKRAWEPSDKGIEAETDEDGVASLQVDPGPAVNVVIPPPPYRPPVRPPAVRKNAVSELLSGDEPSLADQLALDVWPARLAGCARFADEEVSVSLGVRVASSGAITAVATDERDPLAACLAAGVRGLRLAPGPERIFAVDLAVSDPGLPTIEAALSGAPGDTSVVEAALAAAARDARPCLSASMAESAPFPRVLLWRIARGSRSVTTEWTTDRTLEGSETVAAAAAACVEAKFARLTLPEPQEGEEAHTSVIGLARFSASPGASEDGSRPQATTMLGYELSVSAAVGNEKIGTTLLRVVPGSVPSVRLRATPVLASAGATIDVELIRGPGFSGELPETLWLTGRGKPIEAKLDPTTRKAAFALPADAKGWFEVSWGGARAMVFVKSGEALTVSVRSERETYKPGEMARLGIETQVGGQGSAAAVGLFGVDESLAQLATLPGPDALGRMRPKVNTPAPAFGVLDGEALTLGRVRGAHAAQAVITRVGGLPPVEDSDTYVNATGSSSFDPIETLTDRFYAVLGQLHAEVRTWEEKAPAAEKMTPSTMAKLFGQAMTALEKRGQDVSDAYGQRLRLSQLPPDLLALCAPQAVVVVGTRLPEDVEDWADWVHKERP